MPRASSKILVSIEARMTSSRFPGKVLMPVKGKPMLQWMIERVKEAKSIDGIIVATTVRETDQAIEDLCKKLGVFCFRGSEEDVLMRVLNAHQKFGSDVIVELTGDCPLVDPALIDRCVNYYKEHPEFDYVTNGIKHTYPMGMGVQVFGRKVLEEVERTSQDPLDREHVSRYIYQSGKFQCAYLSAEGEEKWPELEITLDTREDYALLCKIIENFPDHRFTVKDIVRFMRANPELLKVNAGVFRKGPND